MTGQAGIVCSTCGADNRGPRTTCERCGHVLPLARIEPGFVLAARYEIREVLGAGGMGVVYKAHDRLLSETVAIKLLRPEAAQTPGIAARFISEIKLARAVSHRNVARIHEYGEDQGLRYISMAFVDGVDLKRVVRERGPLAPERAFEVASQVAEGLHAVHEEGIVHRDLKCSNIMLDDHGVVRLMDFGLAKLWSLETPPQDMTASGQIVGTPEYMSPEQILGRDLDRSSDIYSLAVVSYELFTGLTPFRGDTPIATLMMHLNDPPPLEGPVARRLPASVIPLLRRALSKQARDRFSSALEFARVLRQAESEWIATEKAAAASGHAVAASRAAAGAAAGMETGDGSTPTVTLTPTAVPSATVAGRTAMLVRGRHRVAVGLISALAAAALVGLLVFGLAHLRARGVSRLQMEPSSAEGLAPVAAASPPPALSPAASRPVPVTPERASTPPRATPAAHLQRPAERASADKTPAGGEVPHPAPGGTDAQPDARRQLDSQVDAMLTDAGAALEQQRYDDAILLYDRILELDPRQQMARIGRATAVNARTASRTAAPAAAADAGRAFVPGTTSTSRADAGPESAYSRAFEEGTGLEVQSDTRVTRPPGRIEFEASPERLKAGERYTLRVYFANPGQAPVEIQQMLVTHVVDGRKSSGPVAPSTRTVAPEQKSLLLSVSDLLAEGTKSWSLEVRVQSAVGDIYRNQVTWR